MRRTRSGLVATLIALAMLTVLSGAVAADDGKIATKGEGTFFFSGLFDVAFDFKVDSKDGVARGAFYQSYTTGGYTYSYWGEVTCMTADLANGRAWIGGRLTRAESNDPAFTRHAGEDAWFRVLDTGVGDPASLEPDRSTVLGFVGTIPDSATYCAQQPWAAGNARTHPVTDGKIKVQ